MILERIVVAEKAYYDPQASIGALAALIDAGCVLALCVPGGGLPRMELLCARLL